ncbi:MAG: zinc-binding dehydrogenase [Rhodospirillaceae bacterium]|jgi:NADPH:quinone reductase|nr:zinc-binding dehydrogenase [Rhodospirillaceae bacterium]
MKQMRQWWVVPGPDGGVSEMRTVVIPEPGPGQVLVRIAAAGVSRGELIGRVKLRSTNPNVRATPTGNDFAGTIAVLGEGVNGWTTGASVMGRGRACHAEYAVVDSAALMPTPTHLNDTEAAAIPNVFVTAHDAIVSAAATSPGDTVLITAGSSGVGTAAIQIARHLGCVQVLTTTTTKAKSEALTELGATGVIDTTSEDWPKEVTDRFGVVDVVIDQVGGGLFEGLLQTMAIEGRYVSVGRNDGAKAAIDLNLVARQRLKLIGVTFRTRSAEETLACSTRFSEDLLGAFTPDGLQPVLDRCFPLADLPAAHAYMIGNSQIGKIVITP